MKGLSCNSNILSAFRIEEAIRVVAELGYQAIDINLEISPPFLPVPRPHLSTAADAGERRQVRRSAEQALAPYQVRVNALCPGVVDTAQFEKSRSDLRSYGDQGEAIPLSPLGRMGRPEDIAKVAVFLASDDSDYMTGQAINVSGGTCMH